MSEFAGEDNTIGQPPVENAAVHQEPSSSSRKIPLQIYLERLREIIARDGKAGSMLIAGIDAEGEPDIPDDQYTEEQVSNLRHVIVSHKFGAAVEKAQDFLCGDDATSGAMTCDKESSNRIIRNLSQHITEVMQQNDTGNGIPGAFEALLALTRLLLAYDFWVTDNDCSTEGGELKPAIELFGRSWKTVLAHTDEELGIDKEISRKGAHALLNQFSGLCQRNDAIKEAFVWQ